MGDAGHLVFHRVFQREDVHFRAVELAQDGVEGCGLAGAGGTGHDDDAGRDFHHPVEREHRLVVEGQRAFAQSHVDIALVEQAHGDVIAAVGAVALVADIDRPVKIGNRKAAGNARSRVADLGGKLHQVEQEGIQPVLQLHRDLDLLPDVAIHPESVVEGFLLHLEVDVRGTGSYRVRHDGCHQLGHWLGVVRGDIKVMDAIIHVLDVDRLEFGAAGTVVGGHRFDRAADLGGQRDDLDDFQVREARCEVFLGQWIPRVGDGHDQLVLAGHTQRHEEPAGHHCGVAGGVQVAIAEFRHLWEKRQAVDPGDRRHETIARHPVRHLELRQFRVTWIMAAQLAHDAAADQLIEGHAIEFDHDKSEK